MQNPSRAVVQTENLCRSFGPRTAVEGVSVSVAAGESLVIFGPNGAGKTTLLRLIAGLLKPTSGQALVDGAALSQRREVRRRVGIISHHTLLYDALTPRENVAFAARLYGMKDVAASTEHALGRMEMLDRADTPVRSLSRGMKQRVSIARATVHSPSVILADEPFTGLDVLGASALAKLLNDLRAGGAALVLVTHNIDEGLRMATHAAVMNRGCIARHDRREAIDAANYGSQYQALVAGGG